MVAILLVIVMVVPSFQVQAEVTQDDDQQENYWKHYPYQPPGTEIIFPTDEGTHNTADAPIEWWYANFHLTGRTTGHEYGSFVAFYKIKTPVVEQKEVRIFSISDLASETTYNNVQIGTLTASSDHLDLSFEYITNYDIEEKQTNSEDETEALGPEYQEQTNAHNIDITMQSTNENVKANTTCLDMIQGMDLIENYELDNQDHTHELIQSDQWFTKSNDIGLLPFQYTLKVNGNAQQDSRLMELAVDMDCVKKPLIVGGDGIIDYGYDDFSYYYSLTKLTTTGSISVHGISEEVIGYGWIDHQWGNFVNQNPPPWGLTMTYEWFSINLDNSHEIVVADMWDRETGEKMVQSFTDGLNIINNDGSSQLLIDYSITPLSFWNDTNDEHMYSSKWHLTESTESIDLIITPIFHKQMMRFKENYPLVQQILEKLFPGACFWEGVCSVTGTINNIPVNGNSYVELTHYYENPEK